MMSWQHNDRWQQHNDKYNPSCTSNITNHNKTTITHAPRPPPPPTSPNADNMSTRQDNPTTPGTCPTTCHRVPPFHRPPASFDHHGLALLPPPAFPPTITTTPLHLLPHFLAGWPRHRRAYKLKNIYLYIILTIILSLEIVATSLIVKYK